MERARRRTAATLSAFSVSSTLLRTLSSTAATSTSTSALPRPTSLTLPPSLPHGQAVRLDEPYGSLTAADREGDGEGEMSRAGDIEEEKGEVQGGTGTYRRLDDSSSSSSSGLYPSISMSVFTPGAAVQDEAADTDNLCVVCFSRVSERVGVCIAISGQSTADRP